MILFLLVAMFIVIAVMYVNTLMRPSSPFRGLHFARRSRTGLTFAENRHRRDSSATNEGDEEESPVE